MDSQHWDAVVIDGVLVDFNEVVPARKHFPEPKNVDLHLGLA